MQTLQLNNDIKMPILGLGTWKSAPDSLYTAIRWSLKLGYTHFDTAPIYNNEEAIGEALKDATNEDNLKREDIFITSKLWNNMHAPEDVKPALKETLTKLKTDYIDLFLIHWPVAQKKDAIMPLDEDNMISLNDIPLETTWQAMVELYQEGLVKALGVSNFGPKRLADFIEKVEIAPMVNQIERHPFLKQEETVSFCHNNQIALTAYAPLGSGNNELLDHPTIKEIAKKNQATPAQILLKWNMANNIAVIPQTIKETHLKENISALNISLDFDDIKAINEIKEEKRFLSADIFKIGAYKDTNIFA